MTLDAPDQALWAQGVNGALIHHSGRGNQHLSIRYSERLPETGVEASAGTVGDAYDNALAETINGLFKTEVIRKRGSWKGVEDVEYATLEWVDWFNNRRLLSSIGDIPPVGFEEAYYTGLEVMPKAAGLTWKSLRQPRDGSIPTICLSSTFDHARIPRPIRRYFSRFRPSQNSNVPVSPHRGATRYLSRALHSA